MRYKSGLAGVVVRATCEEHSAGEPQTVLSAREYLHAVDGLRGEYSIAELYRRDGIAESLHYSGSKDIPEARKRAGAGRGGAR